MDGGVQLVLAALDQYGTAGISGAKSNPKILEYFQKSGNEWVLDDDVAWCAAFMNYILKICGLLGTQKLNARSFLDWGVEVTEPKMGDIVILWRIAKDSPFGHVGIFIKSEGDIIYILGGNQSNAVNIKPFSKAQVLAYRR